MHWWQINPSLSWGHLTNSNGGHYELGAHIVYLWSFDSDIALLDHPCKKIKWWWIWISNANAACLGSQSTSVLFCSWLRVGGQAPLCNSNAGLDLQDNDILFSASSHEKTRLFDQLISSPSTVRQLVIPANRTHWILYFVSIFIRLEPLQARGGSSKPEKNLRHRKNLPKECDGQTEVCVGTSLWPFRLVVAFWWRLVVFPWRVGGGDVLNPMMWCAWGVVGRKTWCSDKW